MVLSDTPSAQLQQHFQKTNREKILNNILESTKCIGVRFIVINFTDVVNAFTQCTEVFVFDIALVFAIIQALCNSAVKLKRDNFQELEMEIPKFQSRPQCIFLLYKEGEKEIISLPIFFYCSGDEVVLSCFLNVCKKTVIIA